MKEFRTAYLRDVVELIDEKNPHTITVRDKEYVQVVRCKDCRTFYGGECDKLGYTRHVQPNDFCSWGERKDEVEEDGCDMRLNATEHP